jgi:hypothetical protein
MSEVMEQEVKAPAKAKRPPPEVHKVTMDDGRVVDFVGKAQLNKDVQEDGSVRFDFKNGYSRLVRAHADLTARLVGHGVSQKGGDSTAGEEDIDDKIVAFDAVADRLEAGEWGAERKGGDGFSGASMVIRALMEATGKDQAAIKGYLEGKLAKAKEAGEDLSRQDLYKSFRKPGTKPAAIIERLEREKATKSAKFDGDDLLAEINAG